MDFKSVAGDIVYKLEGKRWTEVQEEVISKLEEAYRLGFLDGEASLKHPKDCEAICGQCKSELDAVQRDFLEMCRRGQAQADGCSDDGEFVPGCV